MEHDLYLIQCDHMSGGMCYYAEHGEKCGVPDAVGYDTAAHARKFRTYEDAQTYIDTQMPEWARPSHHPASYRSAASSWKMPAFEPYLTREFRFRTLCCRLPPAGSGSGFDKI